KLEDAEGSFVAIDGFLVIILRAKAMLKDSRPLNCPASFNVSAERLCDLIVSPINELQQAESMPNGSLNTASRPQANDWILLSSFAPHATARSTAAETSSTIKSRCTGVQ